MLRLERRPRHAPAGLVELDHRGLVPGADVEHAAVLSCRGQRRARHVAGIDVVARLPAVAEDAWRPALGQRAEEDRDHARLAVRVLPRPVDVAVTQRDVPRPVEPVVRRQVLLAGELRDAVGRERPALGLFGRRPVALTVDRAARRAEDDLRLVRPRGLEHLERAEHVHGGVVLRPLDRHAHVDLGGEVETDLRPRLFEDLGEPCAHVALDELRALGHVLALPVREVVHDRHVVAARQQRLDDVRADEPSAPGNEPPHRLVSYGSTQQCPFVPRPPSRCARAHPRPCPGNQPGPRTSATSGLVLTTE